MTSSCADGLVTTNTTIWIKLLGRLWFWSSVLSSHVDALTKINDGSQRMIQKKIFIGVCYHKPAPIVKTEFITPIHVGKDLSDINIPEAIGDNTGNNISKKNKSWCELTALYWMRHNVSAEYYGLMHYRRLLNFARNAKGDRRFSSIDARHYKKFGWNDEVILNRCLESDIITAPVRGVHPVGVPHMMMSNYDMYAREHFSKDMDIVEEIIKSRYPDIYPFFVEVITSRYCFFGNITIMRRELFLAYTDWLFDVLEEAEKLIDISNYDAYQRRIWGFLAERLTNVYVAYARAIEAARVSSLPIVLASNPPAAIEPKVALKNVRKQRDAILVERSVTTREKRAYVVLATDNNYAPHAAVAILSALDMSTHPELLHFYVMESGNLNARNKELISQVAQSRGGRVEYISLDARQLAWLPTNRRHISIVTYYRLVMHDFLPMDVERVIYIDSDVVVTDSLEKLWDIDLCKNPVGASPDEGGVLQRRRLRLPLSHTYFNAGVMVFDLRQIRQMNLVEEVQQAFRRNAEYITLQDQDLLNIVFCNRTFSLPLRWNVNNRVYTQNELDPAYSAEEALAAASLPGIVHFTDRIKPWHDKSINPFTELYWDYRNMTPWAENRVARFKRISRQWLRQRLSAPQRRHKKEQKNLSRLVC